MLGMTRRVDWARVTDVSYAFIFIVKTSADFS